jgi:dTDP-4-amino-4,6-dideoxygalactose transaminase
MTLESVPFMDLGAMADEVWPEIEGAVKVAISGARFIGGPAVEAFENEWAAYCGVRHAIGVANGTDALHLALRALGVQPGDEVVVPASTFVATAEAVVLAGATPRFADVDPRTLLMTVDTMTAAITPRTRGVIAVHLYGQTPDMDAIEAAVRARGLFLVEDAAQAHGARWNGRSVGSFGDLACFSFYPGKNLGAFGDAGAVVTGNADLAERVRSLANHGRATGNHHSHLLVGTTSRLDSLQALVLSAKLKRLTAWTEARQKVVAQYRADLTDLPGMTLLYEHPSAHHVYHLFVVRVQEREKFGAELLSHGVQSGVHYSMAIHQQPAFAQYALEPLPEAEAGAAEVLSLPLYPHLGMEQVDRVIEVTKLALDQRAGVGAMVR